MEGDSASVNFLSMSNDFNPLPPHGGRRLDRLSGVGGAAFQSTPSAWRETSQFCTESVVLVISIHSLRMEGDRSSIYIRRVHKNISIHSLRMEGDLTAGFRCFQGGKFQSTPSAWRETGGGFVSSSRSCTFQSTPSAWRETETYRFEVIEYARFQSTPSAWRETYVSVDNFQEIKYFNPLPPHGGRRRHHFYSWKSSAISIHSLRMEGDFIHCGVCHQF